jgi:signal peptidase II
VTEPNHAAASDLVAPDANLVTEKDEATEEPTHGSGPEAAPSTSHPQPESAPGPGPSGETPPVPGERLLPPPDATPVVPDYGRPRPSYVFLALVSIVTLAADIASKSWAERHLEGYPGTVEVWKNHVTLLLAKNRGGAWGLLQSTSENVRRPFFLLVSVAAIAFIMTLYRRLQPRQRALKWGLPLVLGGALGNVFDRIRYGHVIDFIDMHVQYELSFRPFHVAFGRGPDHHWPTYNVADIAICVGVGLMAIDMFTSKRGRAPVMRAPAVPPAQSGEPSPDFNGVVIATVAEAEGVASVEVPAVAPGEAAPAPSPAEPSVPETVAHEPTGITPPPAAEEPPTQ